MEEHHMPKKFLVSVTMAAAVAGAMFVATPKAEAEVNVGIWIGSGYWNGPGYYHGHYRHWVTCGEGRWIVDRNGYYNVRAIDCQPRFYHYRAKRHGRHYIVTVDARRGHITGVTRD
jgi:hypothetical protein